MQRFLKSFFCIVLAFSLAGCGVLNFFGFDDSATPEKTDKTEKTESAGDDGGKKAGANAPASAVSGQAGQAGSVGKGRAVAPSSPDMARLGLVPSPGDYAAKASWHYLPINFKKEVDVFYVGPTLWRIRPNSKGLLCALNDPDLRKSADAAYVAQATAFGPVGNMFSPYYRQLDAEEAKKLSGGARAKAFDLMREDIGAAFDYYIKNYNEGRPFILAGHGQGSTLLLEAVLQKYMRENPDVYQHMVAAYLPGASVTARFMESAPHLKFAEGRADSGVIISYNTEPAGFTGENPVLLPGALAINPVSWKRDESNAPASESLGGRVYSNGKFVDKPHYASARLNLARGVVECSLKGEEPEGEGEQTRLARYQAGDYEFFYYDLRQNALERAEAYLEKIKPPKRFLFF